MLVIEHYGTFKTVHDCAKNIYPEIKPIPILIERDINIENISVAEGFNEDSGRYKIIIPVSTDKRINVRLFANGLSQIIFKVKHGKFAQEVEGADALMKYKEIFDCIMQSVEVTSFDEDLKLGGGIECQMF